MMSLKSTDRILCQYTNETSQFQVLRIANISDWFFERTVMPRSSILFETFRGGQLEIHTSDTMGAILADSIPCTRLARPRYPSVEYSNFSQKNLLM